MCFSEGPIRQFALEVVPQGMRSRPSMDVMRPTIEKGPRASNTVATGVAFVLGRGGRCRLKVSGGDGKLRFIICVFFVAHKCLTD